MNTEALEYFIKVYEKKSVTAAAKDLYITPQGVSKTIKQLELELETELFSRGPRGVEATEAGEVLHARAKHLRYLIEDLKHEISLISGSKGILNVLVTYSATTLFPLDYLFQFSHLHPSIQVKLKEYPDEANMDNIFNEEIDVGLVVDPEGIHNSDYEVVASGEVVLIVSIDHPLASKEEVSIRELEESELVVKAVRKGKDHPFVERCLEYGFTPHIIHEFGNIMTAHQLCATGDYIGVSTDFVEEATAHPQIKVIRLKEKIPQNIYLVYREQGVQSKAIALFEKYIK
ncbi:LysR family transcriptional regulator [Gracilibacillus sp. S3-1-1]|uniref:LysR family transcriptional regulator n=1 Tax=Gracilibacillus pellucidus TaxID=3095368 RepID=A0ACC6M2U5_9BACI|nr:LysR family transcriptional regulator [Gracilibacillus sp. S3-1-1]MDX8045279.1 LysR family transcriptional regulator [Gracilibacillus sp. S3-1-1]